MSFFGKLSGTPEERAIAGIARNLNAVLNARQGYAGAVEVFGLGRYDGHYATRALLDTLVAEMLEQIRAHEPRLKQPALTVVGRDRELWVKFSLTGLCNGKPLAFVILFHSVFRHVQVLAA